MKRILSLAIVLCCVSLVAACAKKPQHIPSPNDGARTGSGEILDSLETVQAKASAGDVNAQFELGAMYHDGQGVAKDFAKARQWFEKAAAQNDSRAQFNLGVMYYTGEDVKQNYKKAQNWFEKAAAQNNTRAQFNLGVMYYRGEGVTVDHEKALDYFTRSGSLGFAEAQFNLGVMYAKGEGTPVDVAQSYAWFEAARAFGNPRATDIIKEIEGELTKEQIREVKQMAEDLKAAINDRVAEAIQAGQPF